MSSRFPGSDASRPASRRSHPSSSGHRPNRQHDDGGPAAPIQRHDANAMEELLKPSVVVKAHPPTLSVKPRTLQPLMLLPRQYLQLSLLDLLSPSGSFEYARFYESRVKILDLESRMGAEPKVLIAKLEYDKTIYALERQADGLYSLCKLGQWVDLDLLSRSATVIRAESTRKRKAEDNNIAPPLITPVLHQENKKRRLAIEAIQSLVKKPIRARSVSAPSQPDIRVQDSLTGPLTDLDQPPVASVPTPAPTESQAVLADNHRIPADPTFEESLTQPVADTIFDNIRNQYHEALYHSMGSLAYFAKGPLSRARAAFHLDCDSNLEMSDLIEFLKSLVMNTVQIDKKYRDTVPEIISKFKTTLQDSEEEQGTGKPKKRKTKKMRLGKDGLYPYEDEHIRKWWTVRRPQPKDDGTTMASSPQETKLKVSYLRSRETQLQMIIILEVMALEPLRASENNNVLQQPCLPGGNEEAETAMQTAPKKRNRHNLPFLLDVHADRLCIWHSTSLDDVNMVDGHHESKEAHTGPTATADPLKDFCVDIIMPFFVARLPEQCDSINRKLGGPVMVSPPKPHSRTKKADAGLKSKSKSGTAPTRPGSTRSQTLENVLSKETMKNRRSMSRGPSGVIALMRSASTSTITSLKREASEPLALANFPKGDVDTLSGKGTTLFSSESLKRKPGDERAKKDAQVQAELKNAISALRRPNRDVVGKAMAEDAERRATTSLSQLKKSRKPQQHPRFQNVVKATPVGVRFRDAFARSATSQPTLRASPDPLENHPPSSASMIPSSAPRRYNHKADRVEDPTGQSPFESPGALFATPARRSTLTSGLAPVSDVDEGCVLASSPVMSRKLAQPRFLEGATRSTLDHRDSGIGMPSSPGGGFLETPVKRRPGLSSLENFVTVGPTKKAGDEGREKATTIEQQSAMGPADKPQSIFQRLGWDDDYDDLC